MTQDDHAVQVDALEKIYKDGLFGRRQVHALQGVSLEVRRGEIFGLLGPNGAGKTTMIKILLGIVKKTAGEAKLFGCPVGRGDARRRVGYLPEQYRIPKHHTAYTSMDYYGALYGLSGAQVRSKRDELLELVGLEVDGRMPVVKFSKGMKQRLGLALAMVADPELLILDEPTDGVDPVGRTELRDVFTQLRDKGKTIFLNSHLLQETELICDRVAILHQGQLRQMASVKELTHKTGDHTLLTVCTSTQDFVKLLPAGQLIDTLPGKEPGQTTLILKLQEQSHLDETIDLLRKNQVSIAGVAREHQTLEEAFIDVVRGA
ncbi:hypothetical protein BVY04_02505 [bacterium M21]|nr:hypothetical protein BVY04_02505 [bacterium M21]